MKKISVLMVGVDKERMGGMWSVAESYITNEMYNSKVDLTYISTSTGGSKIRRTIKMFSGFASIIKCFYNKHIDIVHIHMAEKGSVYRKGIVIKIARFFKAKTVVQMHAGPIMDWYDILSNTRKKQVKKIFNSCDRMLVLGEYWKKQLSEIVLKEKIEVLYNGIVCPTENKYNSKGKYILFLGMITRRKGAFDLINAIKMIESCLEDNIKVLLCGLDADGEAERYVKKLNLEHRILFPGWITQQKKLEYFKNTSLCVLPSYFEGLSMTVIEAIAYGIPVITTNISTMPEILGDRVHMIEPGDIQDLACNIEMLINDEENRIKQSDYVYKRATKIFSIENNINKILDIYKKCLGVI